MEYSSKLTLVLALAFAMAAAVQQATAQNAPADYLAFHNAARAVVGVAPVRWNATVAAYAQSYAEQRRGDCKLEHSPSPPRPYGENIFGGRGAGSWTPAVDAVVSWVSEKMYYDHGNNTCAAGKTCEHYTQVVWNSTTVVGCGRVVCDGDNDGVFVVCSYSPPGNIIGQSPY